jgi:hypothetical protein
MVGSYQRGSFAKSEWGQTAQLCAPLNVDEMLGKLFSE